MLRKAGQVIAWVLIKLVRLYQLVLSPLIGRSCRHLPTCSQYMIEAIREWGPIKGVFLGLKRIGRCHPWGTSGYDPVPRKDPDNEQDRQSEG